MLKRIAPLCLLVGLIAVFASPLFAATAARPAAGSDRSPAGAISTAVATVTGIAISPLLGTGMYGAYKWFQAKTPEQKADLPWFARVSFWLPAVLIVGACAAKDALGATLPPGFKKPLDVLETVENKMSGLVAAGAVVPFTMDLFSQSLLAQVGPEPVQVYVPFAMLHVAAIDFSWLLNLLTVPFGVAVFAVVWMASHAINVLILLSPWGAVDAALKAARTGLLGLVTLSSTLNPAIGALLSVAVILVCWWVSGWAFRLTVFGSVFSWDFFTRRKSRTQVDAKENWVFAGNQLGAQKIPIRTYGRWINEPENGGWRFAYRPWLFLPERSVPVPSTQPFVAKGLFFSTVAEGEKTLLILPPRYRDHEHAIVTAYGIEGGVQDAGLLKAWGVVRELFGGASARAQVV